MAGCLMRNRAFLFVAVTLGIGVLFTGTVAEAGLITRLEKGDHLKIAAIGTSLTATSFNSQNWFAQMGAWLSAKYPGQVTLSNRAVSGEISAIQPPRWTHGGPWQLDQVLANDDPDVIFIEFAINDAYKQAKIPVADSRKNLKAFIDRINKWAADRGKKVEIVVQTMNNTGPSYAPLENDVGPYYQGWREEAAANHVLLIDHYPNWIKLYKSEADHATWKKYIPDDIHPNPLGTTKVILPEIQRVLNGQASKPDKSMGLGMGLLGVFCPGRRRRKRSPRIRRLRCAFDRVGLLAVIAVLGIFFTAMTARGGILFRLEEGEHLNIAAIGTSLTATSFNPNNWFAQTGAWLSAEYPGQVTLSNRAVSGEISAILPPRWIHGGPWQLEQVLANDNPDAIFIEFAINDAYKETNISPAESANNLKTLIDQTNAWALSHDKTVDIIVQTMNNTGPSYDPYENDVGPYYQAWREEAAASNVLLIDHYPHWIDMYNSEPDHATWKGYIPDDIHPNTLGIAEVILPEVQRALTAQVPEPTSSMLLVTAMLGMLCFVGRQSRCRKTVFKMGFFFAIASVCATGSAALSWNIMPLGDSITYGGAVPGGYRGQLYNNLNTAGHGFAFVGSFAETENATPAMVSAGQIHHEGHPSICLNEIEANLDGNSNFANGNGGYWLSGTADRAAVYPDVVLLMAGINDIALGASATVARDRLDSLVGHLFQDRPTATVIVSSLTPLTGSPATKWQNEVDAYNALIPEVVAKYVAEGRKTYFLDMHNKLTSVDISPDGVHPNQGGYNKMGDAWFGAIQAVPEPSSIGLLITGMLGLLAMAGRGRSVLGFSIRSFCL